MSVCVCILALVTRHENRIFSVRDYIIKCGLSGSTTFFHIISQGARIFFKIIVHEMCVLIFFKTFVRNISHSKNNLATYYHKCP
jgi:cytochrome c oxidase subunit IV